METAEVLNPETLPCSPCCGDSVSRASAGSNRESVTALSRSMDSLPCFPRDERDEGQGRYRVCPWSVKNGVCQQSGQSDQRQIATNSGFHCVCSQRRARNLSCHFPFLTCQPRHTDGRHN